MYSLYLLFPNRYRTVLSMSQGRLSSHTLNGAELLWARQSNPDACLMFNKVHYLCRDTEGDILSMRGRNAKRRFAPRENWPLS
jgi:hypothetical protein